MSAVARALAVIPCLNEREHIARVIGELLDDPAWTAPELIVADGGSDDGTRQIVAQIAARDARVRLIDNPARLQGAAVNIAARLAAADHAWLVRADAHARYPRGFVSALVAEAKARGAASVVVAMRAEAGGGCFQGAAAAAQNALIGAGGAAHRRSGEAAYVDHGHHALFDLERFLGAGGYDETFSHNEDAELDARLARQGGRIWLTRRVEVAYVPRASPLALASQYFNFGRGRARTQLRHRARPKLRQWLPLGVAPALVALALAPAWPLAAIPAAAWAGGAIGYGFWLGLRTRDRCAAAAGVAAMIMHAAWSAGCWLELLRAPWGAGPRPRRGGAEVAQS